MTPGPVSTHEDDAGGSVQQRKTVVKIKPRCLDDGGFICGDGRGPGGEDEVWLTVLQRRRHFGGGWWVVGRARLAPPHPFSIAHMFYTPDVTASFRRNFSTEKIAKEGRFEVSFSLNTSG